jgi:hypothetical protein
MYVKLGALLGALVLPIPAAANGQVTAPPSSLDGVPNAEVEAGSQSSPVDLTAELAAMGPIEAVPAADEPHELASAEELGELRGGQTIVVGNQTLTAVTTGNVINGDYRAGDVSLSDNAFSNFNGVGNLAINTGAQVSLQSAVNLVINVGE